MDTKTQPKLLNQQNEHADNSVTAEKLIGLGLTHQTARTLYDLGLNVLPQPAARKGGYPWRQLLTTRLSRNAHLPFKFDDLFAGEPNLAIMCGRTSGNLMVIDCESDEAYQQHLTALSERGIPRFSVRTARGGHIYLRIAEGEVRNIRAGTLPQTEIKGRGGYVLAPPSLHPSGTRYCWDILDCEEPPTVSLNEVDWLRDLKGEAVSLVTDQRRQRDPDAEPLDAYALLFRLQRNRLSRSTQDYLQNGHLVPQGQRNNALFKAACDMAGNHIRQEDAERHLLPQATASGLSFTEARRTLRSAYSQPRQPSRPYHADHQPADYWILAFHEGLQRSWRGRTATTDRAIFLALVDRCRMGGNEKGVFRASVRELSELARMTKNTVMRGLKRLEDQTLIFKAGQDHVSGANLWQFPGRILEGGRRRVIAILERQAREDKQKKTYKPDIFSRKSKELKEKENKNDDNSKKALKKETLLLNHGGHGGSVSLFNSDLAETQALGRTTLHFYRRLLSLHRRDRGHMPSQLAEMTGLSVNQVNYGLKKLKNVGLVRRIQEGWQVIPYSEDQLIAMFVEPSSAREQAERRRRRHAQDRFLYVAKRLYKARIRREGRQYVDAMLEFAQIARHERYLTDIRGLLADPITETVFELGGEIELDAHHALSRNGIVKLRRC